MKKMLLTLSFLLEVIQIVTTNSEKFPIDYNKKEWIVRENNV